MSHSQTLKSLVQDAVYLDEDAYSGAANLAAYEERIRVRMVLSSTSFLTTQLDQQVAGAICA
eukprot:432058-Pelagomonas_calceolata.AAC.1